MKRWCLQHGLEPFIVFCLSIYWSHTQKMKIYIKEENRQPPEVGVLRWVSQKNLTGKQKPEHTPDISWCANTGQLGEQSLQGKGAEESNLVAFILTLRWDLAVNYRIVEWFVFETTFKVYPVQPPCSEPDISNSIGYSECHSTWPRIFPGMLRGLEYLPHEGSLMGLSAL